MSNRSFQSEDSEEGSICSGLTNLYLGRAERNIAIKRETPPTTVNYEKEESRMTFKQEPCQKIDEDQYSFYQMETNRSNDNFFGARTSASFYQNNHNNSINPHCTNNSLKILKLFQ